MSPCPQPSELSALIAENLTPSDENRLEQHLVNCVRCQTRLDELTDIGQGLGIQIDRSPLLADENAVTLLQQLSDEGPPAGLFRPPSTGDWQPAGRSATAKSLAPDLDNCLDDCPLDARAVSHWGRLTGWYRRNPKFASLVTVVAVLLSCIAVGASIAAISVSHSRSLARQAAMDFQRQRDLALGTLRDMVYAVSDRLDPHDPQSDEAHESILDAAVDGLEQLESSQPDDPTVRCVLMAAYAQKGGLMYHAHRSREAEKCLQDALRLGEGVEPSDQDVEVLNTFAITHWFAGHIAADQGHLQQAEQHYLRTLEFDMAVFNIESAEDSLPILIRTYDWCVGFLADVGQPHRAQALAEEAIELSQTRRQESLPEVGHIQLRLAQLVFDQERWNRAASHAAAAKAAFQQLLAQPKKDAKSSAHDVDIELWAAAIEACRILNVSAKNAGDTVRAQVALEDGHRLLTKLKAEVSSSQDEFQESLDYQAVEQSLPPLE